MTPHKTISVETLVDRLGHKELLLKSVGAFAEAAGVRDSVVIVLRLADEELQPIEPSDET